MEYESLNLLSAPQNFSEIQIIHKICVYDYIQARIHGISWSISHIEKSKIREEEKYLKT